MSKCLKLYKINHYQVGGANIFSKLLKGTLVWKAKVTFEKNLMQKRLMSFFIDLFAQIYVAPSDPGTMIFVHVLGLPAIGRQLCI